MKRIQGSTGQQFRTDCQKIKEDDGKGMGKGVRRMEKKQYENTDNRILQTVEISPKTVHPASRIRIKDWVGRQFGDLEVIAYDGRRRGKHFWQCRCRCGKETIVSQSNLQDGHTSTVRANFRRIYRYDENYNKRNNEMGLNRLYIDRWDSLLKEGYQGSFLSRRGKTIHVLVNAGFSELNAYNLILLMGNEILDMDMGIWNSGQGENQESEFRKIFKKMYENSEIYDVNVFKLQQKKDEEYSTNYSKAVFLNKHCDFQKGLKVRDGQFLEEFVNLFYGKLMDQLENRNKINLRNLEKYDIRFKESLEYIKKVIQKYANGDLNNSEQMSDREVWKLIAKNLDENKETDV